MSNLFPIVSWHEAVNTKAAEVKTKVDFQTVDADSQSATKVFYIWNNRNGDVDVPKMEDVKYTTRDRTGGLGDVSPNVVEAVRDNWFRVRVDSLAETSFAQVGKGGAGTTNPDGTKHLGTNGTTTNVNAATALVWSANTAYSLNAYIQPTVANGYIYKVTKAGTTDGTQPTWSTVEGNALIDGTIEYIAVRIEKTPGAYEILGLANNTAEDGSNADKAGGNFVKISVYADVPISASSGLNRLVQRVSYRYV